MNLESSVKFLSPKSQSFTDSPPSTSDNPLDASGVMGAMGFAVATAGFGMSAFFGAKIGSSEQDRERVIQSLMQTLLKKTAKVKPIHSLKGRNKATAIRMMAVFALDIYSRSAATPDARCTRCKGRGKTVDRVLFQKTGEQSWKDCDKCKGRGFNQPKWSTISTVLLKLAPDLNHKQFQRQIQPLIEDMVTVLNIAEAEADRALHHASH